MTWALFEDMMITVRERLPEYDTYVGIANGGIVMAGMLASYYDKRFAYMYMRHYRGKERLEIARFGGMFGRIEGRVLIVDDIADTGETLDKAKMIIPLADTFVLFKKPTSIFVPTYFIAETDRWIIFPWEKDGLA